MTFSPKARFIRRSRIQHISFYGAMDIDEDLSITLNQQQIFELAIAFVQVLAACSQSPHSAFLKFFVQLLFMCGCSHETIVKVSEITHRTVKNIVQY